MFQLLKRAAASLPSRYRSALRRWWYAWKLRSGRFNHDEPEFNALAEWVTEGDCVLDIGANIGLYTARMSKLVGPDGHVFAFEPVPETFRFLTFNSQFFPYSNVTLVNMAASDGSKLCGVAIPIFEGGLPNLYEAHIVERGTETTVFSMVIDALDIPEKVTFIKIDVEGHEINVLRGMEKLLRRDSPVLVVEGNDEIVKDFLGSLGYTSCAYSRSPNRVFSPIDSIRTIANSRQSQRSSARDASILERSV